MQRRDPPESWRTVHPELREHWVAQRPASNRSVPLPNRLWQDIQGWPSPESSSLHHTGLPCHTKHGISDSSFPSCRRRSPRRILPLSVPFTKGSRTFTAYSHQSKRCGAFSYIASCRDSPSNHASSGTSRRHGGANCACDVASEWADSPIHRPTRRSTWRHLHRRVAAAHGA